MPKGPGGPIRSVCPSGESLREKTMTTELRRCGLDGIVVDVVLLWSTCSKDEGIYASTNLSVMMFVCLTLASFNGAVFEDTG